MNSNNVEWVDIELTNFCNIDCPGCLRQTSRYTNDVTGKEYLSYNFITSKINKLFLPSLKLVNFCANVDEPMSHPKIYELCEYYLSQGCDVHIGTNGYIRNTDYWVKMGELCEKYKKSKAYLTITFALDGTNNETLNKYRVGSDYDTVIKNAKLYIDSGGSAQWQFIVFDYNKHQIQEAKVLREKYGFRRFRLIYSRRESDDLPYERPPVKEYDVFQCPYEKQKRVQVNHHGEVVPCCYVGAYHLEYKSAEYKFKNSRSQEYLQLYESFGKELCNSLHYNDIDEILEGDFFTYMENSFKKKPLLTCVDRCKKNRLDLKIDEL